MNKFFTKIAALSVGLAMAIGVGVVSSKKETRKVEALSDYTATLAQSSATQNLTDSKGNTWTLDYVSNGSISIDSTTWFKTGTNNIAATSISLETDAYSSYQIDKITIHVKSKASTNSFGYIYIGGEEAAKSSAQLTNNDTTLAFDNSTDKLSGSIKAKVARESSTNGALYLGTIVVEYSDKTSTKANVELSLGDASGSMNVNTTQQLSPTASSGGNPVQGLVYSYETGNSSVATVSNNGLITANAAGSTTITVTSGETNEYKAGSVVLNLTVSDPCIAANLDFPVSGQGGVSSYQSSFEATDNNNTFTITNANNNNNGWSYIGVGRKSAASTATIISESALSQRVTSIVIDFSLYNSSGLDSASLYVADNSSFTSAYSKEFKSDITTQSLVTIEIPQASSAENKFYKIEFVCNNKVSSNGYIHIDQIIFRADPVSTTPSAILDVNEVTLYTNNTSGVTVHVTIQNCNDALIEWATQSEKITLENDDEETVTIKPTVNAAEGDVTVELTVVGTDLEVEETLTVHLVEPGPGETEDNPFSPTAAVEHIDDVRQGGEHTDGNDGKTYYVTGIVSKIVTEYSSQHSNITFDISVDGETTGSTQLRCYRATGAQAINIAVGDVVIVSGTLVYYQPQEGDPIYEFNAGCSILSRVSMWSFDHLELSSEEGYDNHYYQGTAFTPDGLKVLLWEHNSATSDDRYTDVTDLASFDADLTTTGTKSMKATYDNHESNSFTYYVVEKPSYDIAFGSADGSTKINGASVTGNDWTVTTAGTTSYTQNSSYSQVGSSSNPATSITFTKTINSIKTLKTFFIDLGGFGGTAGTVTLKVGETTVGTGSLNGTNDLTVAATSYGRGSGSSTSITITITGIAKGVKVYGIAFTAKTDAEMVQGFIDECMLMSYDEGGTHGSTGGDGSCKSQGWYTAAKSEYIRLPDEQKSLFNSDSTYSAAKQRLVDWAVANSETFDPANHTFTPVAGSRMIFDSLVESSSNATIIIVVISLVSLTAVGGYFLLKKKKEQ